MEAEVVTDWSVDGALLSSEKQDWRTPENFLAVVRQFAPIGLDPCGTLDSVVAAKVTYIYPADDGLALGWGGPGLVYCNPPYGSATKDWVEKMKVEAKFGVEIVALVAARPDTRWFNICGAVRVCFWKGRLKFIGAPASAPFPSAVLYYGERAERFEQVFGEHGVVVPWAR